MGILSWAIFGLIVGAIARLLMPGRDPLGCLLTMALGIVGSLLGGFLGRLLGLYGDDVTAAGIFMSIAGAMILLAILRQFGRRRK